MFKSRKNQCSYIIFLALSLYLESQNNQKQPEISKRKSLSISIF